MRILITGAAGFIGFSLARQLLARGDSVIGIDSVNDYYQVSLKQGRLQARREWGGKRLAWQSTWRFRGHRPAPSVNHEITALRL